MAPGVLARMIALPAPAGIQQEPSTRLRLNKTLLALLVAASRAASRAASLVASLSACSSGDGTPDDIVAADPTAAGNDPITGLPADDGAITEPSTFTSTGGEAPVRDTGFGPARLSQANHEAAVSKVFGVYSGRAYGTELFALPRYPMLEPRRIVGSADQGSTSQQDTCSNGGTANLSMDWSGSRVTTFERRAAFDDCQFGELLLDGEIEKGTTDNYRIVSSGLTTRT